MKRQELTELPSTQALEAELQRVKKRSSHHSALRRMVYLLLVVAAAAILVATRFMPVLRIYGTSMAPTMNNGDIAVTIRTAGIDSGDVIAFYSNNKVLVKRVIGTAGDWIDMDENGVVQVNGEPLEEPYVMSLAYGDTDIELPYQVPEGKFFVMGDQRASSVDSRSTAVGSVSQEQIVGKVVLRIWPLPQLGAI